MATEELEIKVQVSPLLIHKLYRFLKPRRPATGGIMGKKEPRSATAERGVLFTKDSMSEESSTDLSFARAPANGS